MSTTFKNTLRAIAATTLLALTAQACVIPIRSVTADEWDQTGKAQYYVGFYEAKYLVGLFVYQQRGKVLLCRLRDDNSLDCSEQSSLTDTLANK